MTTKLYKNRPLAKALVCNQCGNEWWPRAAEQLRCPANACQSPDWWKAKKP